MVIHLEEKKLDDENMKDFRTKYKCLCFEVCEYCAF